MSSTCANSQQEARLERVKFSGSFELHLTKVLLIYFILLFCFVVCFIYSRSRYVVVLHHAVSLCACDLRVINK